jgi:hypothetical protein
MRKIRVREDGEAWTDNRTTRQQAVLALSLPQLEGRGSLDQREIDTSARHTCSVEELEYLAKVSTDLTSQ